MALVVVTTRTERVNLVEEKHGRRALGLGHRSTKDPTEVGLGLAKIRREKLGPVDHREVGAAFLSHRLDQQGLAGARRPVKQDPLRTLEPKPAEKPGVLQRKPDQVAEVRELGIEPGQPRSGHPTGRAVAFGCRCRCRGCHGYRGCDR